MSGGRYNYTCYRVGEEYVGRMYDKELDGMMKDLAKLLHTLEWWQSADSSEDEYREAVRAFKKNWFGPRDERLRYIIESECEILRDELLEMIGGD